MTRLVSLRATGFRGIVDTSLDFDGGSIVLGGGNGMGKSAFVDAIEFLYTGSIGSLQGTAGLSLRQHGAHLRAPQRAACVSAAFEGPGLTLARPLSGAFEVPVALEDHLTRGASLSFILRRSQLQHFIHARPADRYRSLAELIGIERLDDAEAALKRARDDLQSTVHDLEARLAGLQRQLEGADDEPDDDRILTEANERLEQLDPSAYRLDSVEDIPRIRATVLRSLRPRGEDQREAARLQAMTALRRGIGQSRLRDALATYIAVTPGRGRDGATRAQMLNLLQTLRQGRDYLRFTESDECPLCQSDINARVVLSKLVTRIAELEDVSLAERRIDQAREELTSALHDTRGSLVAVARTQAEAGISGNDPGHLLAAMDMLRESLHSGAPVETLEMAGRVETALERWTVAARRTLEGMESTTIDSENGDEVARSEAVLSVLETVKVRRAQAERSRQMRERLTNECDEIEATLRHKGRALAIASRAYLTFIRVKNHEIQSIFNDLQSDLVHFYDFLHPEEGHGALSIAMDPQKRGSSELKMDFFDRREEDPRAFGSEGHLDSLGLCIFLAFARRFNGDWPLLVLDDVVASVDASHKRRVAALLFREFGDRQLLITTHDARWFNDLRGAEAENGQTARTRNLVIESWTLEEGPRLRSAA